MKKALKDKVSLSPLDTNKKLELWTDASNEGLGYILTQPFEREDEEGKKKVDRRIISIGSTGLTPSQTRYSPVQLETLAIVWSLTKCDYFCRGAPVVEIKTDSTACKGLFKKSLFEIKDNKVQRMVEKTIPYNIEVTHVKGATHYIADYLSR